MNEGWGHLKFSRISCHLIEQRALCEAVWLCSIETYGNKMLRERPRDFAEALRPALTNIVQPPSEREVTRKGPHSSTVVVSTPHRVAGGTSGAAGPHHTGPPSQVPQRSRCRASYRCRRRWPTNLRRQATIENQKAGVVNAVTWDCLISLELTTIGMKKLISTIAF
ncbi:hypothetical protein MSG28_013087 [Choristoneura fumiferana]|uniref:Uncharacterized protein n=1 Tax=Choristoneura fumiferana TaxID=7141 RepID=A0ACC0KRU9_CHOFU|nr:hypothetical protein MSG28_013087 [Choristoneura fumiferana]